MKKIILVIPLLVFTLKNAFAQPKPGDVYYEYSQHVGVDDWRVTDPNTEVERAKLRLPNPIHTIFRSDLDGAIKAEILLDRWGGHINTFDHQIRFNENNWVTISPIKTTPPGHEPEKYYYQDNPIIEIPLSHLKEGENTFEATCRGARWGQWGLYSLILRIYYDPAKKPHPAGKIISPHQKQILGEYPEVEVEASSPDGIARVDILGYYEGIDEDGDGVYQDYHRDYHQLERGQPAFINHHIGSSTTAPYRIAWDTRWVPDQEKNSIKIIARIQDNKGCWYVTEAVEKLSLVRKGSSVKLYKPYDVPEIFGVRKNRTQRSCKFKIPDDHNLHNIAKASFHLKTWNGSDDFHQNLKINDWAHPIEGQKHHYVYSQFLIPKSVLKRGENTISFHSETEHHACEVLWPGPMVVARYGAPVDTAHSKIKKESWLFQEIIVDQKPPQPRRITDVEIIDVNLDGKLDLWYSGSHIDKNAQQMTWYENTGDPLRWIRHTPFQGPSLGANWGDVDGDGDLDLITGQDRNWAKTGNIALLWMQNPLNERGNPAEDTWQTYQIHPDPTDPDDILTTYVDSDGKQKSHLDLNRDGRLDFIIAAFKNTLWFVPGPENPKKDKWQLIKIAESDQKHGSACIADINRDGNLDIVWGQEWYANPGDPTNVPWKQNIIDTSWTDEAQVEIADLNKDGWLDVVLTGEESDYGIAWYRNPGAKSTNKSLWWRNIILQNYDGLHSLELADFDKDGDLDIMAAEMHHTKYKRVVVIENIDIEKNQWQPRVISFVGSHKAKVADIDNDGDLDIVGKNYEKDTRPRIWLNPCNKKFPLDKWERHVIDEENASRYIIRAGDLNRDGKPDIITGTGWYKNPDNVNEKWQRFELGKELGTAHIIFDFDGDGDLDIFGEGFGWVQNEGNEKFTLMKNIEGKGGFVQGAVIANFKNDKSWQIAYTYKNGDGIHLMTIPENPVKIHWSDSLILSWDGRTKSVDVGDIDRDGDSDILFSGRDGKMLQWLRNDREGLFKPVDIVAPPSNINHRCRLADVNHDGKLDAVFGHKGKLLDWYEQGTDLNETWQKHIIADSTKLNFDPLSLDIADMDRDGDFDIIVGEHTPKMEKLNQCRLLIFENKDGSGKEWITHLVYLGDEHHQGTQVVDIDSDGDLDIISVGYRHSRVLLYENKAN